jgi:hypothetical protein
LDQGFISLKFMQQMVPLLLVGWLTTGPGGKFHNNSKMDQAGVSKDTDIVMTTTT